MQRQYVSALWWSASIITLCLHTADQSNLIQSNLQPKRAKLQPKSQTTAKTSQTTAKKSQATAKKRAKLQPKQSQTTAKKGPNYSKKRNKVQPKKQAKLQPKRTKLQQKKETKWSQKKSQTTANTEPNYSSSFTCPTVSPVWHVALFHGDITLLKVDLQSSSLHQPPRCLQDLTRQHGFFFVLHFFLPIAFLRFPRIPLVHLWLLIEPV